MVVTPDDPTSVDEAPALTVVILKPETAHPKGGSDIGRHRCCEPNPDWLPLVSAAVPQHADIRGG